MGMYTEVAIGVRLVTEVPESTLEVLRFMCGQTEVKPELPQHPLFATERWGWMLRSGGSYYFPAKPFLHFAKDDINSGWYLTVWTNIKNYGSEWEHFLDWLAPNISTEGFIGHYRYEECDDPTLLYCVNGKIEMRDTSEAKPLAGRAPIVLRSERES